MRTRGAEHYRGGTALIDLCQPAQTIDAREAQMKGLEKTGTSDDVPESKYGYRFLGRFVRKHKALKYNDLLDFKGAGTREKRGAPKNEGTSDDVYENKGPKNGVPVHPTMFMKTNDLCFYPTMLLKINDINSNHRRSCDGKPAPKMRRWPAGLRWAGRPRRVIPRHCR